MEKAMHESSFFQLLPATGWFSSRRESKGIICSLTNFFVSTAVSCLFRKTTEKQEFVWIRQSQTKLALLVARDNNLLQKKIKGNSLKNVIETECSFTIKNRTQASMFLQNVGGFFQVTLLFRRKMVLLQPALGGIFYQNLVPCSADSSALI